MLDIIGNIKVNESKPERVKMLIACIRSFYFLKDSGVNFILNLDGASPELVAQVSQNLQQFKNWSVSTFSGNYGEVYMKLLEQGENKYVLNFLEDHFCVLNDANGMDLLLMTMDNHGSDLMKASFFEVEQKSARAIKYLVTGAFGKSYLNDKGNFKWYSMFYGTRYYIGVNFITTRKFAEKFWSRKFNSTRPHEWEISEFNKDFLHTATIPNIEVLAAIDDDHGEENSCLLKRQEPKFQKIWSEIA